jgi:hypothetical protein
MRRWLGSRRAQSRECGVAWDQRCGACVVEDATRFDVVMSGPDGNAKTAGRT